METERDILRDILRSLLNSLIFFCFFTSISQAQYEFRGKVTDPVLNEPVAGAKIRIMPDNVTDVTGDSGAFSFRSLRNDKITVTVNRIGYKEVTIEKILNSADDNFIVIRLEQMNIMSGEIEVFSTKIENQLKYSIFPIALVTRKDLTDNNTVSVSEVLSTKPGLNLVRDGIWATDVNIRGLSRDNVVVLINGNRIETANNLSARLSLVDINTIERIEVIKGGTSSIYGSGGTGGVVSITTLSGTYQKKFSLSGILSGSYSSVNEMSNGGLSLFMSSKNIYANLYTLYREASDVKISTGVIPNSSFRDYGISLNSGIRFGKNNFLTLDLQQFKAPYAGVPGGYPLFPNKATVTYEPAERELYALTYANNKLTGIISALSAKVFMQNIFRDVQVIPNTIVFVPKTATSPAKRITNLSIEPDGSHYSGGAVIQANFITNSNNKLIGGFDLWRRKLTTSREQTQKIEILDSNNNVVATNIVQTGDVPIPDSKFTSFGIFAQDEISFMRDRLFLDISARADGIFISNEQSVSPLYVITNGVRNNSPSNQKILWAASEDNDIAWSFNTGANYKLSDKLNYSLNFSAAFRSPSLEERFQYIDLGSVVRLGNPFLDPETGYFISTALKYWSNELNLSLELYSNYLSDLVTEIPGTYENRPVLIKTNISSARLAGFDAEWEYNFYKSLVFYGGVSYINGENTDNGSALPQIAPLNGTIGLKYSYEDIFTLNFNTVIYSDQNRVAAGEVTTPGYAVYNFYSGFNKIYLNNFELGLYAGSENIFNRNYGNHLSTNRGTITSEPGRNVYLKAKIVF